MQVYYNLVSDRLLPKPCSSISYNVRKKLCTSMPQLSRFTVKLQLHESSLVSWIKRYRNTSYLIRQNGWHRRINELNVIKWTNNRAIMRDVYMCVGLYSPVMYSCCPWSKLMSKPPTIFYINSVAQPKCLHALWHLPKAIQCECNKVVQSVCEWRH